VDNFTTDLINCVYGLCLIGMLFAATFVFVLGLCQAAKRGEEQGEAEMREWQERRGGQ